MPDDLSTSGPWFILQLTEIQYPCSVHDMQMYYPYFNIKSDKHMYWRYCFVTETPLSWIHGMKFNLLPLSISLYLSLYPIVLKNRCIYQTKTTAMHNYFHWHFISYFLNISNKVVYTFREGQPIGRGRGRWIYLRSNLLFHSPTFHLLQKTKIKI